VTNHELLVGLAGEGGLASESGTINSTEILVVALPGVTGVASQRWYMYLSYSLSFANLSTAEVTLIVFV